jgi:hypothetical protein
LICSTVPRKFGWSSRAQIRPAHPLEHCIRHRFALALRKLFARRRLERGDIKLHLLLYPIVDKPTDLRVFLKSIAFSEAFAARSSPRSALDLERQHGFLYNQASVLLKWAVLYDRRRGRNGPRFAQSSAGDLRAMRRHGGH